PILIGTTLAGKGILRLTSRFGDAWNLGRFPTPAEFNDKLTVLRQFCSEAGRDPARIENCPDIFICVDTDEEKMQEKTRLLSKNQLERGVIGTPEQCIKRINEYIPYGATYFMVYVQDVSDTRTLRLIGEEVIPAFRD